MYEGLGTKLGGGGGGGGRFRSDIRKVGRGGRFRSDIRKVGGGGASGPIYERWGGGGGAFRFRSDTFEHTENIYMYLPTCYLHIGGGR